MSATENQATQLWRMNHTSRVARSAARIFWTRNTPAVFALDRLPQRIPNPSLKSGKQEEATGWLQPQRSRSCKRAAAEKIQSNKPLEEIQSEKQQLGKPGKQQHHSVQPRKEEEFHTLQDSPAGTDVQGNLL